MSQNQSLKDYLLKNYGSHSSSKDIKPKSKSSNMIQLISESDHHDIPSFGTQDIKLNKKNPHAKTFKNLDTHEIKLLDANETMQLDTNKVLQTSSDMHNQMKTKEITKSGYQTSLDTKEHISYRNKTDYEIKNNQFRNNISSERKIKEDIKHKQLRELNMGELQLAKEKNQPLIYSNRKSQLYHDDPASSFQKKDLIFDTVSPLGKKLYNKIYPENRFKIIPGSRWDGIDRSNGFEKKWFAKHSELSEKTAMSYAMQDEC